MSYTTTSTKVGWKYGEALGIAITVDDDEFLTISITDEQTNHVMHTQINAEDIDELFNLIVRTQRLLFGVIRNRARG